MITVLEEIVSNYVNSSDKLYRFQGLSTDGKPTGTYGGVGIENGSSFLEMDTGKIYYYDEQNAEWVTGNGGGGGGPTYTAGANIQISDQNVISATDTTYSAGDNIQINDQNVISATDTTYSAGANIQIDDQNVISATDTTYSSFVGATAQADGSAGLVPAPLIADLDKFLKADGSWATPSGGLQKIYFIEDFDQNSASNFLDAYQDGFLFIKKYHRGSGTVNNMNKIFVYYNSTLGWQSIYSTNLNNGTNQSDNSSYLCAEHTRIKHTGAYWEITNNKSGTYVKWLKTDVAIANTTTTEQNYLTTVKQVKDYVDSQIAQHLGGQ